jgi:hypothetical protein
MRESTTFQAILREGRQEGIIVGVQRVLLRQGTKRFGPPDPTTVTAIEAIKDIDQLEALLDRLLDADIHGGDDLLRTP